MRDTLLVIAQSARALAAGAVRAGYRPAAVDFFADEDTAALGPVVRVDGGWSCGFRRRPLMAAIEAVLGGTEPAGVVLGSGFEDRPRLVASIAARHPLFGCGPAAIAALKHPERLAAALGELGIPHPPITRDVPARGDWLLKRRAGSGGAHIRPARPGAVPPHHYAQRRVSGESISALVLADGGGAQVVAYSRQSADPSPDSPYRFAGVTGPVPAPAAGPAIAAAADALALRFGLRGLVSLDCLVDGDRWWLLEVNPRPGASLDALDRTDIPLISAHIAACRGIRLSPQPLDATIRATLVVYAEGDSRVPPGTVFAPHVLDRPPAGATIGAGQPIATVVADGATVEAAERLAGERAEALKRMTGKEADDGQGSTPERRDARGTAR